MLQSRQNGLDNDLDAFAMLRNLGNYFNGPDKFESNATHLTFI